MSKATEAQVPRSRGVPLVQLKPFGSKVLLAALIVLPIILLVIGRDFELNFLSGVLIWCILTLSLDLIWGYAGIISLGQGVFFGAGAYAMGYMLTRVGGAYAPVLALLLGVSMALAAGLALAFVSFRSRVGGLFFAVITLALSITAELAVMTWKQVTGGDNGIFGIPKLGLVEPGGSLLQYYVVLAVVLLAYLVCRRLVNSHFGRVLTAIRENELRVSSIGFDANLVKTLTFGFSAALAAVAGALFATYNGIVTPSTVGFQTAAIVLIWLAIGGRGFLVGAFVGTFVVQYVQFYMTDVLDLFMSKTQALSVWPLVFGAVFLIVIIFYPDGLMGLLSRLGPLRVRLPAGLARRLTTRTEGERSSDDKGGQS